MISWINTRKKSFTNLFSHHRSAGHPGKRSRFQRNCVFDQRCFLLLLIFPDSGVFHSVFRIVSDPRDTFISPADRYRTVMNGHRLCFVILPDYRIRHWTSFFMVAAHFRCFQFMCLSPSRQVRFLSAVFLFLANYLPDLFLIRFMYCFGDLYSHFDPVFGWIRNRFPASRLSFYLFLAPPEVFLLRKRDSPRFLYRYGKRAIVYNYRRILSRTPFSSYRFLFPRADKEYSRGYRVYRLSEECFRSMRREYRNNASGHSKNRFSDRNRRQKIRIWNHEA